jgi:hypothetical protein
MNKEILHSYWKNPQSIDWTHLKGLNQLCEEYPYAVGLKQLYCKALIIHKDLNFEKVLKSTAIQTAQRSSLRFWLLDDLNSNEKYLYPSITSVNDGVEDDFSCVAEKKELVFENSKIEIEKVKENIAEEVVLTVVETNDLELNENKENLSKKDIEEENYSKDEVELNVSQKSDLQENINDDIIDKTTVVEDLNKSVVSWDEIKPVTITLLPIPNEEKTLNSNSEDQIEIEIENISETLNKDNKEVIEQEILDKSLLDVNDNKDFKDEIKTSGKIINEKSEIDDLDQQILNAAILGSSYQIPESQILINKAEKNNKVSFLDWFDRIEKGDLNDEEFAFRKKAEKIIDQFLANQPKIKIKKEFYSAENYVKKGSEENDDIISETLIKIYIQQGHIQRAIEGYQKLASKFPEKSTYFNSEIDKLK